MSEVLLILVAVLILFGGKRIPEVMRSLGAGMHEFKKGMEGGPDEKPTAQKPSTEEKLGENRPGDVKPQ